VAAAIVCGRVLCSSNYSCTVSALRASLVRVDVFIVFCVRCLVTGHEGRCLRLMIVIF